MQCPKCGKENPDNTQLCRSCSQALTDISTIAPDTDARTSKLAVASLLLSVLSGFTFLITAVLSIALGITSLCRISRHKTQLKGKCFAVTGIVISAVFILAFCVTFVLWSIDAAPIPNDYTIADLRSAPPQCSGSYELLNTLTEEQENPIDAPTIGLSAQDVNTIEKLNEVIAKADYAKITEALKANSDNIYQAWKNAQKAGDIISQLNTFDEIADLTVPDLETEIGFLRNLRHLCCLYQAYIHLQSHQANNQTAVNELIKLDSVFRKLSTNARSIVTKLVCFAGLNKGIRTANFIVNNPQTSQESLQLLAEHFTPLANEQMCLRNSVISEYLMPKKALTTQFDTLRNSPMFKYNSTLRLRKNFCEDWIAVEEKTQESESRKLSVWPSIYPSLPVSIDSDGHLPWFYKLYNPIGSLLVSILTPAMEKVFELKTKLQVQDDLFQIVLSKKLGSELSLKARAYSDRYIIDMEKKKIFSPGPDGKPHTCDDIKLLINPEAF